MKEQFSGRMVRVHFGEDDRWQGKPLYEAIVATCKELGIAEVIVFRGIEGFGSGSRIRRSGHWTFSKDAPIQLSIVDTEEQIARLLPIGIFQARILEWVTFYFTRGSSQPRDQTRFSYVSCIGRQILYH